MCHNTEETSKKLSIKVVGKISDHFYVPSFQRGYRWERKQVRQLLDDIERNHRFNQNAPYYLQPVVVAKNEDGRYDLIDGQQRLTTIMLIYQRLKFLKTKYEEQGGFNPLSNANTDVLYTITYETRDQFERGENNTSTFIQELSQKELTDLFEQSRITPDTLYMWHACKETEEWFNEDPFRLSIICRSLEESVKIIWYELNQTVDSWEKFADLNIGKIPLTNAELVKALFLRFNENNLSDQEKARIAEVKAVIVDQWDSVERELSNEEFWKFLTNRDMSAYDTKIDLLFDIVAGKEKSEKDDFFTFLHFEKAYNESQDKKNFGKQTWNEVYLQYLRLRDWFEDKSNELYHGIGYLVTVDSKDEVLRDLFHFAKNKTHAELKAEIKRRIKATVALPGQKENAEEYKSLRLKELSYGEHKKLIENILILFNVMSMQALKDKSQRYSFAHHKSASGGWSLEHIHAQKSDTLITEEQWTQWIRLHQKSLKRFRDMKKAAEADAVTLEKVDELSAKMSNYLASEKKDRNQIAFNQISKEFAELVKSSDTRTEVEYIDEMANMALLSRDVNSMLNNSVFDVKRGLIMDALSREFIPVCTQRVFLKAYTSQDDNQLYFWGHADREAYIDKMEELLKPYLPDGYCTEVEIRKQRESENNEN